MSPLLLLAVSLTGGCGAGARWLVDALATRWLGDGYPWGTQLINITGSFGLGVVTGLATGAAADPAWAAVLGTGFLGGYTTFSTASLETVRLLLDRRPGPALAAGLGTAILAVGAAALGMALMLG